MLRDLCEISVMRGGGLWFNGWLNYKKIEIKEKGAPKSIGIL